MNLGNAKKLHSVGLYHGRHDMTFIHVINTVNNGSVPFKCQPAHSTQWQALDISKATWNIAFINVTNYVYVVL